MNIGAIIQARMGSTRLPGKVMKLLNDKTILSHVIERITQSNNINNIIIATTTLHSDNIIVEEAKLNDIKVFRGSEDDVLSRYYYAALENKLDYIVRITSDCPLIDPNLVDNIIDFYLNNNYDIVTNDGMNLDDSTFPRGLDTEVFSFKLLESAFNNANKRYQREHVTPYIYENSTNVYIYKNDIDYSKYRWTLDTQEDFELIKKIYGYLYKGKHDFYLDEIINLYKKHPNLIDINSKVKQKQYK